MHRIALLILIGTMIVIAGGSSVGNLKNKKSESDYSAMASGYWDTRNDTIADDTIVFSSTYSGLMCIGISNESADDMTIMYTTETNPTLKRFRIIPSYTHSGLMPVIHTIYGTAGGSTAGAISLYFWNTKN